MLLSSPLLRNRKLSGKKEGTEKYTPNETISIKFENL